jgi:hypothetical protein
VDAKPDLDDLLARVDAINRAHLDCVRLSDQHWAELRDRAGDIRRIVDNGPADESDERFVRFVLRVVLAELTVSRPSRPNPKE